MGQYSTWSKTLHSAACAPQVVIPDRGATLVSVGTMSGQTKRAAENSPAAEADERHFHKAHCAASADDEEEGFVDTGEVAAENLDLNEGSTAAALPPCSPITPRELRYGTSVPEPPMPSRTGVEVELKAVKIICDELQDVVTRRRR